MGRKKRTTASKSVSESTSLAADAVNPPPGPGSPTPVPPTPTPDSRASTSTLVEPPQPQPTPDSEDVQTKGTDQPEELKTRADALKEQGNVLFKNKEYGKAVGLYSEAISEFGD